VLGPLASVLSGLAVAGLYLLSYKQAPLWGAIIFFIITSIGAFFLISRKVLGKIEPVMQEANKHIQAGRVEPALQAMQRAFKFAPWHPMIGPQLHAQVGSLQYVSDKTAEAEPNLRKASKAVWTARAMLGCLLFKKKDAAGMTAVFEELCKDKKVKKEPLMWTLFAFCTRELVGKDAAIAVLERAHGLMRADEGIEKNLERLKAGKDMKTHGYGQQWFQFRVGDLPKQQAVGAGQRGGGYGPTHPALRGMRGKRRR
jgi:hypothetical protein